MSQDDLSNPAQAPGPLPQTTHIYRANLGHYEPGRDGHAIEYIIVHATEGTASQEWLTVARLSRVSAHILVERNGLRDDLVDWSDTAWHAGNCIPGVSNSNSLGMELENSSNGYKVQSYPQAQLNTAAHWVAGAMYSFGVPWDRVLSHALVALPVGRKHDPRNFDWLGLQRQVLAWLRYFRTVPQGEQHLVIY